MSSSSSSLRPVDRRSILPSPGLWGSCLLQRVFQIALSQSTRSASRWLFFTTHAKGIGRPSPHPVHRELLIKKANFALARARSPFRLFKTNRRARPFHLTSAARNVVCVALAALFSSSLSLSLPRCVRDTTSSLRAAEHADGQVQAALGITAAATHVQLPCMTCWHRLYSAIRHPIQHTRSPTSSTRPTLRHET